MNINEWVPLAVGLVALLGALLGFLKWVRPKFRAAKKDVRAGRDALLGRDAVYDSITGKEISPALPGIGQRMASTEQNVSILTVAVGRLADMHDRVNGIEARVQRLEHGDAERQLARTESIELLRTIDNAIKSDPKEG